MTPRSFEQTRALSLAELHALRASVEPRVRLWATWALATRDDTGTFARLDDVRAEPDAGVRRHLVVVLAGRQDTSSLETIVALDPDDEVRATALQYLIRLTRPTLATPLIEAALAERATVMRRSVALESTDPDTLERLLLDRDTGVFELAWARLDALRPTPLPRALHLRWLNETDGIIRERITSRFVAADEWPEGLAQTPTELIVELLHARLRARATVAWAQLAPLAARGEPRIDLDILRLLAIDTPGLDWSWVLACVTRAQDPIHDAYSDVAQASWCAVDLAVNAVFDQPDHDGGAPLCAIIELALAGRWASAAADDDDESPELLQALEDQRMHLRAFLARARGRSTEVSLR
jgi:hypothetical protein